MSVLWAWVQLIMTVLAAAVGYDYYGVWWGWAAGIGWFWLAEFCVICLAWLLATRDPPP